MACAVVYEPSPVCNRHAAVAEALEEAAPAGNGGTQRSSEANSYFDEDDEEILKFEEEVRVWQLRLIHLAGLIRIWHAIA